MLTAYTVFPFFKKHSPTLWRPVDYDKLTGLKMITRGWAMKDKIHPRYIVTKVTCGCGNTFLTRSTQEELKIDICNACHPFYTGKLKYVDTAGRIEKFQKKFAATGYASLNRGKKAAAKTEPAEASQ
jgi:large subunit ribosomal protein L31